MPRAGTECPAIFRWEMAGSASSANSDGSSIAITSLSSTPCTSRLMTGRVLVGRDFKAEGHDNIWAIGDCALIPLNENASKREDFAPPTAQFAVREAAHLSLNIKNVIEKKNTKPFKYKSKGALASLGAGRGVAEVLGLRLTGRWPGYFGGFIIFPFFQGRRLVFLFCGIG